MKKGVCKIADFGFGTNQPFFKSEVGALGIRAPEFDNLQAYAHSAVDVWAFGVMMHYTAFKKYPFCDERFDYNRFRQSVNNDPYIIPENPPTTTGFKEMLTACFEKDPKKRISTLNLKNLYCFDRIFVQNLKQ